MRRVIRVAGMVVGLGASSCSVKEVNFRAPGESPSDASLAVDSASGPGAPVADAPADSPAIDAMPLPGSRELPAASCAELKRAGRPSAVYWVLHPTGARPAFEVYCEQDLRDGGWALVVNSVRRADGTTTAFWQFGIAEALSEGRGTLAPDQNYYNGSLYLIGTEYMDVFVDLQGKLEIAAVMTATRLDPNDMKFVNAVFVAGQRKVYDSQFSSGWSSRDADHDPYTTNCATDFNNVAQHYSGCWLYNLGSDGSEGDVFDGGVGPHVNNSELEELGLAVQPDGGTFSQVNRIARFTRW